MTRLFGWLLIGAVLLGTLAAYIAGDRLTQAAHSSIGPAPAELKAQPVVFDSASGATIHGWLVDGAKGGGVVLLLHPVRSDRSVMTQRARFLSRLGYSLLWLDLQAHGESSGDRITFGARESLDVETAVAFLRTRYPGEKIGAIGISLGGASIALAKSPLGLSAVVLESVYPTIEEAVTDRLRLHLGAAGPLLAPLLLAQLPLRLGISVDQLHPIDHIADLGAPLLLISGTKDEHTTSAEAKRLFAAAREPKQIWLVDGAAHVDLHGFAPKAYETRIAEFLSRYLKQ